MEGCPGMEVLDLESPAQTPGNGQVPSTNSGPSPEREKLYFQNNTKHDPRGLNNYQYYIWGVPYYQCRYTWPQNPIIEPFKGTLERNPVENCSGPYIISVRSGRAFPRSLSPGERRALLSWAGVGPTVGLWVQGLGLRV